MCAYGNYFDRTLFQWCGPRRDGGIARVAASLRKFGCHCVGLAQTLHDVLQARLNLLGDGLGLLSARAAPLADARRLGGGSTGFHLYWIDR
jgi:hypothetical protein